MLSASTTFLSTFIFCIVLRKGGFVKYSSYVTNDEFSSPFMEHWTLDANWSTNHKSYCGGRWTWPTPLQC